MKTFETEKGNIPDGATHTYDYGGNECGYYREVDGNWLYWGWSEAWCVVVDNQCFYEAIPIPQTNIETPEEKWVAWNGDGLPPVGVECEVYCPVNPTLPDGDKDWMNTEVVAIIDCGFGAETTVVYKTGWSAQWYVDAHPSNVLKFRKPETEAERVEREREEKKAIDVNAMCLSVTSLKLSQAVALYDAGYRKENE